MALLLDALSCEEWIRNKKLSFSLEVAVVADEAGIVVINLGWIKNLIFPTKVKEIFSTMLYPCIGLSKMMTMKYSPGSIIP